MPLLAGCSSHALVANGREIEGEAGLALALYHLPGAELRGFHFHARDAEDGDDAGYWVKQSGVKPEQVRGWLVFADPFHMRSDQWLRGWNAAYAPRPILGGLATGRDGEFASQVYLNGEVYDEGGVAVAVGGAVGAGGPGGAGLRAGGRNVDDHAGRGQCDPPDRQPPGVRSPAGNFCQPAGGAAQAGARAIFSSGWR